MNVAGRRFTVVGAGRSGRAAANALAAAGADVRLVDDSDKPRPEGVDDRVVFASGTHEVRAGDVAVLSPGIKEVSPIRAEIAARAAEVIGEVELFYRACPAPILAITGTDGKSTTTTMLGAICAATGDPVFVGGNLGNPLCESLITGELEQPGLRVIAEISAFQLTTCDAFRPRVAVVTNIAEDHLDYHGGYDRYQAAKRRIWAAMTSEDVLIINGDDAVIGGWELPDRPVKRWFSAAGRPDADARFVNGQLTVRGQHLMTREDLPLLGIHNVANALAAGLAAEAVGIDMATARRALMAYEPLRHRLQTVRTVGGVRWVNDSKATNPNAAMAGVRAIEGPLVLLAGGSVKDTDFTAFGAVASERARVAILFGTTRHQIAATLDDSVEVHIVEDIHRAVALARELAVAGDTVLLGPACASFDQFRSYGHRGDVFCELVEAMS